MLDGRLIRLRRHGQVIQPRGLPGRLMFPQETVQRGKIVGMVDVSGKIVDPARERIPHGRIEWISHEMGR